MNKNHLIKILALASLVTSPAFAGTLLVPPNEEVKIAVHKAAGSLLQFPVAIKTITASDAFEIADVGADLDAQGQKTDVKVISVKATGTKSDRVSFLLVDGRTINAHLIPAESGDKHYDLLFAQDSKKRKDPRHLQSEIDLLKTMIRDESGGYVRQIGGTVGSEVKENFSLKGYKAKVFRLYAGKGVKGYVFELRNNSGESQNLNASQFEAGEDTALVHVDKESLESCAFFSKPECTAKLYIVMRSQEKDIKNSKTPFQKMESK